ncbi:hypothetical protein O0L34_g7683 [Tuta absoluta]|nr:hypothetical protein O0L34_g7683 [Tuta absoluta]
MYSTLTYNSVLTQPCRRAGNCIQRTGPAVSQSLAAEGQDMSGNGRFGSTPPPETDGKPRKRCCPYDFDSSRCKVVDDRVLCGFNRNGAWPQSSDIIRELSDGCRLRNGRLECGYHEEPYHNLRRPPAWDVVEPNNEISEIEDGGVVVDADQVAKLKKQKNEKQNSKLKPDCVEVEGRVVCMPKVGK